MPIPVKLATVTGALRCNRWGQNLEGEEYRDEDDSVIVTLAELLNDTSAYMESVCEKNGASTSSRKASQKD
jgi:hypothetical protein